MNKRWGAVLAAVAVGVLVLGVADRPPARADTVGSVAIWCPFLAGMFNGDLNDACDGLDAADIATIADQVGDEDGVLEPGELAPFDLEANQITDGGGGVLDEIYAIAFVDDDGRVTFDVDAGLTVAINDDGNDSDSTPPDDGNVQTCDGDDDLDCGSSIDDDGDGVVVAAIGDGDATPGDAIEVNIEQGGHTYAEMLQVVGAADEMKFTLLEPQVQKAAPGDEGCLEAELNLDTAEGLIAAAGSTLARIEVTDADDVTLTRTVLSIASFDDNIATIGDSTAVTIDTGRFGIAALAVVCGGEQTGLVEIEADIGVEFERLPLEVVDIVDPPPPTVIEMKATPNRIACNGIATSGIRVRLRDDNELPVADGTLVTFETEGDGHSFFYENDVPTSNGEANTFVSFESFVGGTEPFEVRATAGVLSGTIRVYCDPGGSGCDDPNFPPHPASPPCPPPPCIEPSSPDGCEDLDSDGDGVLDVVELELGTDRFNPDTDGDGFLDLPAVLHASPNVDELRDNCPLDFNPGQENSDGDRIVLPGKAFSDATRANSDAAGDACDGDDDGDGLPDVVSPECESAGGFVTDPLNADTDGDLVLDSAECALGTNPNDVGSVPLATSCNSALDDDADGIPDLREFCFHNTSPFDTDTDFDGCDDAKEIASINADRAVNSVDLGQVAIMFGPYTLPASAVHANFDINKDGRITSIDLSRIALQFGPC